MVAIALFLLWVLFNGRLTWEIAAFGALVSLALSWFVGRFVAPGLTLKAQFRAARIVPDLLGYAGLLLREIMKANLAVIRLILSSRDEAVPKLAHFTTPLRTGPARALLADSITLTPGTITVHLQGDEYLVHCLDEGMEEGLAGSELERQLLAIEGRFGAGAAHAD
ncbi:MAG TPA: Na+/H+ antiporter subunit E [Candidatus Limnocylindria bacterium]|nr:Na+/H+ antiporter subunit E [Candidatus Limnocylindria bacterium]